MIQSIRRTIALSFVLLSVAAVTPQAAPDLMREGQAAYAKKEYARSAELYQRAYRLDPKQLIALYNAACSLALGGKKDEAIAALRELADKGYNNPEFLRNDADFASLKDDPRMGRILAKMEKTAEKNPPRAVWAKPYTFLPVPADASTLQARLGDAADTMWRDGDVLTFLARDKGDNVFLSGGIQEPMKRIPGTDLYVAQLKFADWDHAIVTYTFIHSDLKPGARFVPRVWRGPLAPNVERSKPLKGRIEERTLHMEQLGGEERKIKVYLPPNAPKQGLPAFFMADGQGCEEFATALEPLILSGKVRPCAIVGVFSGDYAGDRSKGHDPKLDIRGLEYVPGEDDARFAKHLHFFVDEVGAYVAKEFGISRRRQDLAVTGFSNGGAFSAAVAYRRPEAFGTAMPLSLGVPTQDEKPKSPFPRMMFATGTLEGMYPSTKQMYERMKAEGAEASFETYVAGHDPEMWDTAFANMAPRVFPNG